MIWGSPSDLGNPWKPPNIVAILKGPRPVPKNHPDILGQTLQKLANLPSISADSLVKHHLKSPALLVQ